MQTRKKQKPVARRQPGMLQKPIIFETHFAEVSAIIVEGRRRAFASVNALVIETYWKVGKYISGKIETAQWGDGVVPQLAEYLQKVAPDPRGLSARNLWRMMQFHDFYRDYEKVSTALAELPWSSHLLIISKTRSEEERVFYLNTAIREGYDFVH